MKPAERFARNILKSDPRGVERYDWSVHLFDPFRVGKMDLDASVTPRCTRGYSYSAPLGLPVLNLAIPHLERPNRRLTANNTTHKYQTMGKLLAAVREGCAQLDQSDYWKRCSGSVVANYCGNVSSINRDNRWPTFTWWPARNSFAVICRLPGG